MRLLLFSAWVIVLFTPVQPLCNNVVEISYIASHRIPLLSTNRRAKHYLFYNVRVNSIETEFAYDTEIDAASVVYVKPAEITRSKRLYELCTILVFSEVVKNFFCGQSTVLT